MTFLSYLSVCAVTAYVCSCVKEDDHEALGFATARLFGVLAGGIGVFGGVIQLLTVIAG